jgi:hypothetical protein
MQLSIDTKTNYFKLSNSLEILDYELKTEFTSIEILQCKVFISRRVATGVENPSSADCLIMVLAYLTFFLRYRNPKSFVKI